jgi:hypothetical protein
VTLRLILNKQSFSRFWPWFFFAAAFESLLFAGILLSIPSESGLSLPRFGLIAILLLVFVLGMYYGLHARHDAASFDSLARTPLVISSALLSLTSGLALFLLRYLDPERLLPVYERLSPLLWFFLVFGIQSAFFLLLLQNGFHPQEFLKRKPVYVSARFAFFVLIVILLFASITKLGITPDTAYWGEPGVAILGWQFVLAILVGFLILVFYTNRTQVDRYTGKQENKVKAIILHPSSFIIPLALWLAASALWLSVPWEVLRNSFYAPITPPANIPLPYSDAGFYDYLSQSLLIGTDYAGRIPPRPLYVVFLAALHALFGQDYLSIIAAQTLILALFPVALYFLAKKLHTPAAGVTVALFAVFREYLGLWISSNTRVVNSKMFTTDFPTALGIAALCLVVIWWLERRDLKSTLVAGGAFGLLLLFRIQSFLVLPFVFILAWFAFERKTKQWVASGVAFALVMTLVVAPWLIHNYAVTGSFTFDDPSQMGILNSQYSFGGHLDPDSLDIESESLGGNVLAFVLENPGYVSGFITGHFLNTQIGGLLALPLIERFDGLNAPVNLYWVGWDGSLAPYNLLVVLVYLAVLAVGIGAAWRRLRWIALAPLAFNLGYALSNGVARFSGWRYNLPADWMAYFYFGIGVIEILGGLALVFGARVEKIFAEEELNPSTIFSFGEFGIRHGLIVAAFVLVGAAPWLAEGLASPRYTSAPDELIARLAERGYEEGQIEAFLSQPEAVILEGRMLYPRLYRRGEGIFSANPWPAYAVREYARIGFILLNEKAANAIFQTRDVLDFPQGADAIVLACRKEDYLDARLVVFPKRGYQNAPLSDPCH